MKIFLKKIILAVMLLGLCRVGGALEMKLETDRADRLYKIGDRAKFTARILEDGKELKQGMLHVFFTNNGQRKLGNLKFDLSSAPRPIQFTGSLDCPGFLRTTLMLEQQGKKHYQIAVTGFEPEKIRPGAPAPEDFDRFWSESRAWFRKEAGKVKFMPAADCSTSRVEVRRVEVSAPSGRIVTGFLAIPRQGFVSYPLLVNVPGAGPGTGPNYGWAASGFAVLTMNVFPYHVAVKAKERKIQYDQYTAETDYRRAGITDRNTYFYREFYLGADCAIDAAAELPEIDKDHVGIFGSSQGGGSAVILGGLNRRIKGVVSNVTALCDHNAELSGRSPGWPYLVRNSKAEDRAAVAANSKYYDAVNFAARLKCPARVIVGFLDTVCHPGTVYAMYNGIPTDKKIFNEPDMRHEVRFKYLRQQGWLRNLIWLDRLPELPEDICVQSGDLRVHFDRRTFWSLKGVEYRNKPVGIRQQGSFYGNAVAIRSYGFTGTGHRENEDERVLEISLKVDGREQKLSPDTVSFSGKKIEFSKKSIINNIEVVSVITVEDGRLREDVRLEALNYMRLTCCYLAMYPWDLGFREYRVLDAGRESGETFNGSGAFRLNKAVETVALYHPEFRQGIVSKIVRNSGTGVHREQYRDAPGRYRKHYSQIWTAKRLVPGDHAEFAMVTSFFPASEVNWLEQAKAQAEGVR